MIRLLKWTALKTSRRKLIGGALASVFGYYAGVAAGGGGFVCPVPCIGPGGTGPCNSCNCSGHTCKSGCGASCQGTTCCCGGSNYCWTRLGTTCCDCNCLSGSFQWYCYCYS